MHAIYTAENKDMVEMLLKVEGTFFVINFVFNINTCSTDDNSLEKNESGVSNTKSGSLFFSSV